MSRVLTSRVLSPRQLVRFGVSLLAGFASGYAMARLAKALGAVRKELVWGDDLALLLGTTLLGGAAYVALLALDRRRLAKALECDADLPASTEEVTLFRLQAAVLALAGLLIAAPVLLAPAARASREAGLATVAAVAVAFALQTALNRAIWVRADEVLRDGIVRSAAVAFWVGQALLFLWAAAWKLSVAPALSPWEAMVGLMALYLAASAAFSIRLQQSR